MRPIGNLQDETLARRFGDYLLGRGIDNQVDPNLHGSWEVWVLDDENIEKAKSHLDRFRGNPDEPAFVQAAVTAARQRQSEPENQPRKRARVVDARTLLSTQTVSLGPLTIALIGVSVAVAILTSLGANERFLPPLFITELGKGGLPEIGRGQFWRLFTPMFLHFGLPHILFNMLILRDLGSMIEARKGSRMLLVLVLVIAGTSNLAQHLVSGPSFGGMSGVNYGLLGYIWMQGRFNPASRLSLHSQTIAWAIVWFFLCISGLVPHIANTVHAVGFGLGIAWGFIDARVRMSLGRV